MSSSIIIGILICLISTIFLMVNLFKLVQLDAHYRGMKRPNLWAWFVLSGQRGGGLILYLLKRRNYPRASMSDDDFAAFQGYKRRALISWCAELLGVAVVLVSVILQNS